MSAPSGIKVPPSLSSAFSAAQASGDDVRALVFTIEGEAFTHLTTVKPKGSYKDDIALLPPTLPSPKTPASFAYRLDSKEGGRYEWMMVTFVPDDAGVRAKMLQASSRAGLLKALGANNFKHDWFATSQSDLTPAALNAHLNHIASPPPLTASEAALAEIKAAEQEEAKRAALDANLIAARRQAVVGLSGKTQFENGVEEALKTVAKRSDDGWIVTLEISATNTNAIKLLKSESCTPSQLASKLPEKSPAYVFYSYPTPPPPPPAVPVSKPAAEPVDTRNMFHASEGGARLVTTTWTPKATDTTESAEGEGEGETKEGAAEGEKKDTKGEEAAESEIKELSLKEPTTTAEPAPMAAVVPETKGRVVFVYWCPSGSPVKFRMVYSTTVRSIQQDAKDKAGVDVVAKIETSDASDLTESQLKSSLPTRPTHASSLPTPTTSSFGTTSPAPIFGAPAPSNTFGGAFGRPRPTTLPVRTASQIPLPVSTGPSTPVSGGGAGAAGGEEEDSKESIRKAFDAFGPRVGGGGGGFARPRPAGRR